MLTLKTLLEAPKNYLPQRGKMFVDTNFHCPQIKLKIHLDLEGEHLYLDFQGGFLIKEVDFECTRIRGSI